MNWQLTEAKNKLSEVCDRALSEGPQLITRRGKQRFYLVTEEDFEKQPSVKNPGKMLTFEEFLLTCPSLDGVEFERIELYPRDVEL